MHDARGIIIHVTHQRRIFHYLGLRADYLLRGLRNHVAPIPRLIPAQLYLFLKSLSPLVNNTIMELDGQLCG